MTSDKSCRTCDSEITAVGCDVASCKFHGTGNYCQAERIKVESKNAQMCAETYCSTYKSRT